VVNRKPKKIELGEDYVIWFNPNKKMTCRFIKTTKCGFNFLNLETSICVLPHHLYPMKDLDGVKRSTFYINQQMKINKHGEFYTQL
jgi:hypothetical protein